MAPVPTILSWPFLFNIMDILCGAKGMDSHVNTQPFWEYPQWPACKAPVTGKQEPASAQDSFQPNELIHGSYVWVCFLSAANAKRGCLNHSNRGLSCSDFLPCAKG